MPPHPDGNRTAALPGADQPGLCMPVTVALGLMKAMAVCWPLERTPPSARWRNTAGVEGFVDPRRCFRECSVNRPRRTCMLDGVGARASRASTRFDAGGEREPGQSARLRLPDRPRELRAAADIGRVPSLPTPSARPSSWPSAPYACGSRRSTLAARAVRKALQSFGPLKIGRWLDLDAEGPKFKEIEPGCRSIRQRRCSVAVHTRCGCGRGGLAIQPHRAAAVGSRSVSTVTCSRIATRSGERCRPVPRLPPYAAPSSSSPVTTTASGGTTSSRRS